MPPPPPLAYAAFASVTAGLLSCALLAHASYRRARADLSKHRAISQAERRAILRAPGTRPDALLVHTSFERYRPWDNITDRMEIERVLASEHACNVSLGWRVDGKAAAPCA